MNINDYQNQALRTWRESKSVERDLAISALGLSGESGEYAELIKKYLGHGHKLDKEECKKELGDILWYIAICSHVLGFSLSEIAEENITKLHKRYPNGFSEEISKKRYQR